jgi:hypothetical protein
MKGTSGLNLPTCWVGLALLALQCCRVTGQQCPQNSIYHCDDPSSALWDVDPTVICDRQTCEWRTGLFSPDLKPVHCANLEFIRASDPVPDFLEPCLLWELIYGEFAPTSAPTTSRAPSASPRPSASPTGVPSVSPTMMPSTTPTVAPSKLDVVCLALCWNDRRSIDA